MGERNGTITTVLISLVLLCSTSGIAFAFSQNWSEVTRITGTICGGTTEPFTCDHVDWRIRWSYEPTPSNLSVLPIRFRFNVLEVGGKLVEFFIHSTGSLSGTLYINQTVDFYLAIDTIYTEDYTIIVEENLDSIPEFPSWIITSIFLAVSSVVVIVKRKYLKAHHERKG